MPRRAQPGTDADGVTVIIPSKDDPRIERALQALAHQRTRGTFSVRVIDSSTVSARDRVEALARAAGAEYVYAEATVSQALRLGVEGARSPLVVTLPTDAEPVPDWLELLTEPLRAGRAAWAAGPAVGRPGRGGPVWHYFETRTRAYYERLARAPRLPSALPGWNTAYRRDAVLAVGNFDSALRSSEDWDLHLRLHAAGHAGLYVPGAVIYHDHPHTLGQLFRRELWYKRGQIRVARKHGRGVGARELATPAAYAFLIAAIPFGFLHVVAAISVAALWALLAIKQMMVGLRQRDPYFPLRPVLRLVEGLAGILAAARELPTRGRGRRRPRPASADRT